MTELQRAYYAIIPAKVRYDKELTPNAKLLYGEITALCNERGYCWASNQYFAELYGVSKQSISCWINALAARGYVKSVIQYKEGTKEILNRYLSLIDEPIKENLNTPIQEKPKENNTVPNITTNNTNEYKEKRKRFTPPSVEDVRSYCIERKNGIDPQAFVDYYSARGWKLGKETMKDWKAAVRTWENRRKGDNAKQNTKYVRNEPTPEWLKEDAEAYKERMQKMIAHMQKKGDDP